MSCHTITARSVARRNGHRGPIYLPKKKQKQSMRFFSRAPQVSQKPMLSSTPRVFGHGLALAAAAAAVLGVMRGK